MSLVPERDEEGDQDGRNDAHEHQHDAQGNADLLTYDLRECSEQG